METAKYEKLTAAGIDVNSALERFMGNEMLLDRFLKKFAADENYWKLCDAVAAGKKEEALTASHTLKGVTGNLSMTDLFDLLTRQVQAFRDDDWKAAADLMPLITQAYEKVLAVL